jgi:pyridinium-3,5-biscarboxylic acid mononucleotide sulfurtransferase
MDTELNEKLGKLRHILSSMGSVAIAFSGGIDSTYLLKVAHDCLGERVVALTAVSASLPAQELAEAQELARQINAQHVLINSHETEDPRYLANTSTRCYFCKSNVYDDLVKYAQGHGFSWVADGSNLDDVGDYRPGRQAAREFGIRSPLLEAELTKDDIRTLARIEGLPNWDKPAAACLSSRIPYGTMISMELLSQVEMAERTLRKLGIRQVRVRHHETIARIEVEPQDFETILSHHEEIVTEFQSLGYTYIALDLAGFRSGSLNAVPTPHGQKTTI